MMYCAQNSKEIPTLTPTKKATICMMTHKQIPQMFNEENDGDDLFIC